MSFGQSVVQSERFRSSLFRLGKVLFGRSYAVDSRPIVVVGDAHVWKSILRIEAYGFTKVLKRLLEIFIVEPVPEIPAFKVRLISLCVFCFVPQKQLTLFTRKLGNQSVGN